MLLQDIQNKGKHIGKITIKVFKDTNNLMF
jgi:hypothetical protein